ncbi:FeoB small GTPase domain-containing protein [Methanogenium organophilum]|uniref:50S ribosome-binding GTPase n=1 Tax=Methanogenium organophilum TaxID=2199 RepID=A0A9X9T9E9_METOG|nr:FeoB small GTPase domain-containing protein [Methanogenium organophilum]WAI02336.1 50S ribosome-binding GTPase [Methanogenium organophilum]
MTDGREGSPDAGTVVLMLGNPNVGKSALFNRMTGANAIVSNYPGTTVDFTSGTLIEGGHTYTIIDVPGTYSLEPRDAAEEVAVKMLRDYPDATVMIVLDATKTDRGLYIALEVMERGMPCIVAVNMMDAAHEKKITVDIPGLQRILGVPVVSTTATSGEGVRDLAEMLRKAQVADIGAIAERLRGGEPERDPIRGCGGCGGCGGC